MKSTTEYGIALLNRDIDHMEYKIAQLEADYIRRKTALESKMQLWQATLKKKEALLNQERIAQEQAIARRIIRKGDHVVKLVGCRKGQRGHVIEIKPRTITVIFDDGHSWWYKPSLFRREIVA